MQQTRGHSAWLDQDWQARSEWEGWIENEESRSLRRWRWKRRRRRNKEGEEGEEEGRESRPGRKDGKEPAEQRSEAKREAGRYDAGQVQEVRSQKSEEEEEEEYYLGRRNSRGADPGKRGKTDRQTEWQIDLDTGGVRGIRYR